MASKGERDFRKDKADGVRRKEFEEEVDRGEVERLVGEVERFVGVAKLSSTEASDSELASN